METITQLNEALAPGYRIEREIGTGGMATVYLAHDTKHRRRVALKVLKPEIATLVGVERFLSEIRVTATLQHPNLLPLFDSGEANGLLYYVMPFVDGESLRARLDRERQLPVDEVIHIGTAVAGALEYAHANGVIHRDLKPENILFHAGQPLVTDFGIALAVSDAGGARMTQTGLSLGTPQYMSPEQATGDRAIDRRADIYSLGAVIYEMLTGGPPHVGATVQATIAKVITERPQSVTVTRPAVPDHVALAVEKALEKTPADRWTSVREFAETLQGRTTLTHPRQIKSVGRPLLARLRDPITLTLAATVVALAAGLGMLTSTKASPDDAVQFSVVTHGSAALEKSVHPLAISPDGRAIAYAARDGFLYVRTLSDRTARRIVETNGANVPFFSPDGSWVGYFREGKLFRVPVGGGASLEIADVPPPDRITWTADGLIVFSGGRRINVVPATGGRPKLITQLDSAHGEANQLGALTIDDGRTIVYTSIPSSGRREGRLAVTTVAGEPPTVLDIAGDVTPVGFLENHLLYAREDGVLFAVPFDVRRRRTTGPPRAIANGIGVIGATMSVTALSANGTFVYAADEDRTELVWMSDAGASRVLLEANAFHDQPRVSPDGRRVAAYIGHGSRGDFWIYDLATTTMSRLTTDSSNYYGEWSPDGRYFYYVHLLDKKTNTLTRRRVDGSAPAESLFSDGLESFAVHPDGHKIIYTQDDGHGVSKLVVREISPNSTPRPLTGFPDDANAFRFSPDGRWLAYMSGESGRYEVYVRPFPGPGSRVQVSAAGGAEPVWTPDGTRLFYRNDAGRAIFVAVLDSGRAMTVLSRRKLFFGNFDWDWEIADYDVSRDGKELLMVRFPNEDQEIVVTTHWEKVLREHLRVGN